jgi:hypothetical protein
VSCSSASACTAVGDYEHCTNPGHDLTLAERYDASGESEVEGDLAAARTMEAELAAGLEVEAEPAAGLEVEAELAVAPELEPWGPVVELAPAPAPEVEVATAD